MPGSPDTTYKICTTLHSSIYVYNIYVVMSPRNCPPVFPTARLVIFIEFLIERTRNVIVFDVSYDVIESIVTRAIAVSQIERFSARSEGKRKIARPTYLCWKEDRKRTAIARNVELEAREPG